MHSKKFPFFSNGTLFYEKITSIGLVTCSFTGEKYYQMLNNFVIPSLQQRQYQDQTIFIQYGAPPLHTSFAGTATVLQQKFTTEKDISGCFRIAWLSPFQGLTPCDFWLSVCLKSKITELSRNWLCWTITKYGMYERFLHTSYFLLLCMIL